MKHLLLLLIPFMASADPFIVAHRGASGDAPENTLPAFELAWKQEADAIEGDFHLTADGHVICNHDKTTKKMAGKNLTIKDSSLSQLQALDLSQVQGRKWAPLRFPTLSEVLGTVPDRKLIYVEIKSDKTILPALLKDLSNSGLKDEQIVIISFSTDVIRAVKKQAPQYKAMWLSSIKKDDNGNTTPAIPHILKTLKSINADGFSAQGNALLKSHYVKAIKEAGYSFHVWTVDNPSEAERFAKYGVDSITTNYPRRIRDTLK